MELEAMRRQRGELVDQLRTLHNGAEGRDLTPEEQGQWDGLTAKINSLKGQIARQEQVEAEEAALLRSTGLIAGRPATSGTANAGEAGGQKPSMTELIRRAAGVVVEADDEDAPEGASDEA